MTGTEERIVDHEESVLITRPTSELLNARVSEVVAGLAMQEPDGEIWMFHGSPVDHSEPWPPKSHFVLYQNADKALDSALTEIDRRWMFGDRDPLTVVINQPSSIDSVAKSVARIAHSGPKVRVRVLLALTSDQRGAPAVLSFEEGRIGADAIHVDDAPHTIDPPVRSEARRLADASLELAATYLGRLMSRDLEQRSVEPEGLRALQWLRTIAVDAVEDRADVGTLWQALSMFPDNIANIGDRNADFAAQYVHHARALHTVANASRG